MTASAEGGAWRRWARRGLAGMATLLLVVSVAVVYLAYGWQPTEESGYRSAYLARVQPRQVATPVARFSYFRSGSGPPVVLVPGGALWSYSWRDTAPVLARHFTVYAVDLPGQGYTSVTQDGFGYDLDAMSGALGSFLDAVGLRRVALVGHSWGGAVALYFAERHPERVHRLALLASPGLDVPSSPDWRPLELPVVGELVGKLMDRDAAERTLRKSFAHPERVTPELVAENWAPLSRRENRRALWLQQRRFDYARTERHLAQVRAPTLVLWGDADRFDRPWQAGELARRIAGATVRVLPGCGHSLQEDCPGPTNAVLSHFLTRRF